MRQALYAIVIVIASATAGTAAEWPQWGGPFSDFTVGEPDVDLGWSDAGPAVLWARPLGPGYSGIVTDGDRLLTMTRRGDQEVVVALSRQSGEALWESSYDAPVASSRTLDLTWGEGPSATPLVVGERVCTLGFTGVLQCLDAETGEMAWRHDLAARFDVAVPYFGHSSSPLQYRDVVIVIAGGAFAFRVDDGELVWQNREFVGSYSTPILVERGGRTLLIAPVAGEIVGMDAANGSLLWRHEHANRQRTFLSGALLGDDDILFASAYFRGSVGLKLAEDDSSVTKVWENPRLQLSYTNSIRVGDVVYGFHNSILTAVDLSSGEILWRSRDFQGANLLRVGDRFLLLDRWGRLSLVSLGSEGPTTHASARILEGRSWTAPTLIGHLLYARNHDEVVALDLSRSRSVSALPTRRPQRAPIEAPVAFLEAKRSMMAAYFRSDGEGLGAARTALEAWTEDERLGHLAHYYIGFASFARAQIPQSSTTLADLRDAEAHFLEAVRLEKTFADAHSFLSRVFPMYYRYDPGRASVVGTMGDEHLEAALRYEPRNPRVLAAQGLDLINSPPEYGGDPEAGLELLEQARELFEQAPEQRAAVAEPDWGRASTLVWMARALRDRAGEGDFERAAEALAEALRIAPEFAVAQQLLGEAAD